MSPFLVNSIAVGFLGSSLMQTLMFNNHSPKALENMPRAQERQGR